MKKTILVDFDGVIHSYTSVLKGARVIPDLPVPGAIESVYPGVRNGWTCYEQGELRGGDVRKALLIVGWINVATWAILLAVYALWRDFASQETARDCLTLGAVLLIAANTKGLGLPK